MKERVFRLRQLVLFHHCFHQKVFNIILTFLGKIKLFMKCDIQLLKLKLIIP